jgi:hypothetical protein
MSRPGICTRCGADRRPRRPAGRPRRRRRAGRTPDRPVPAGVRGPRVRTRSRRSAGRARVIPTSPCSLLVVGWGSGSNRWWRGAARQSRGRDGASTPVVLAAPEWTGIAGNMGCVGFGDGLDDPQSRARVNRQSVQSGGVPSRRGHVLGRSPPVTSRRLVRCLSSTVPTTPLARASRRG